ncbi:hypothetical protein BSL78_24556 [Apostichopus japonicus]|uniref:BRICHOS domain-containing protein n=1 Tax=Stichopus japonicus TaxID=307972 RepID=A0A2G8JS98_STIJA|nr:hypothetical protein BSL78_24556 [Apostichopus japonicus]
MPLQLRISYLLSARLTQEPENFNLRIDIDGEKCTESVHADDRQNIVTFHYTGENGREGGVAMYDFNQGLAALKDSNGTACFFMNAYDLPVIQLSDLQLKARNKEVMAIREEVTMQVNGAIPDGFLEVSAGPLFADLCQDLSSYWLVLATDHTTEDSRNRRDGLTLSISVPAGATAAVIVLDGSAAGGTFVISL